MKAEDNNLIVKYLLLTLILPILTILIIQIIEGHSTDFIIYATTYVIFFFVAIWSQIPLAIANKYAKTSKEKLNYIVYTFLIQLVLVFLFSLKTYDQKQLLLIVGVPNIVYSLIFFTVYIRQNKSYG